MIYYKSEETDITYSDFVEDDMKKSDESMVEPECPDYPDYFDYDDYDEYEKRMISTRKSTIYTSKNLKSGKKRKN